MTYSVTKLITEAYYASGVVSRDFETVSGAQCSAGLDWLNDILLESVADVGMIPYSTTSTFTGVAGQEQYPIVGLIGIDTLTFVKETVRYGMSYKGRNGYTGESRALDISSLPYEYYYERTLGGSTISMYFNPDEAYEFTIVGTFALLEVVMNQDLSLILDRFYRTYLKFALAERICLEHSVSAPMSLIKSLEKYISIIDKNSRPLDLRLRKQSTLSVTNGINYAEVNLGNGWTT